MYDHSLPTNSSAESIFKRFFISLKIKILAKNYPSTAKDGEWEFLSKLCTRYIKVVGEYKDTENNFYSNDSLNDDLEGTF